MSDLESKVDDGASDTAEIKAGCQIDKVYFLSELGYDTHYFDEESYQNLLEYMARDERINIVMDYPLSRLDRPEFLNDELTYWIKDEKECIEETERIPNRRQYKHMRDIQLNLLEERIIEIRKKVPNADKIIINFGTDDFQYTASAMLNEMLIRRGSELQDKQSGLTKKKKELSVDLGKMTKQYKRFSNKKIKKAKQLNSKIKGMRSKLRTLDVDINDVIEERRLYREKKVRPAHQFFTAEFMQKYCQSFEEICKRHDVACLMDQAVLTFGELKIDYAHSRHATWGVLKARDKQLERLVHGKEVGDIDAIVESGHHGIGFKRLVKLRNTESEVNFKGKTEEAEYVTLVLALPFENQERISSYLKGKEYIRLSGGKSMGTRKHAVIDRAKNDSVSGVTVLSKRKGLITTEVISYSKFLDGSILVEPNKFSITLVTGDEHIGSQEGNRKALDDFVALYHRLLTQPIHYRKKEAYAVSYINVGDVAEANSAQWDHRYHSRKGSSIESMSVILNEVADYLMSYLMPTLEHSGLMHSLAAVPGNHADAVLRRVGMRETDYLVQRLIALGIPIYESDEEGGENPRVYIGGKSNARAILLEGYGKSISGEAMFEPQRVLVQHDPKGSGTEGIEGAGKKVWADVTFSGHTHENYVILHKTGNNKFAVASRCGTLQGVTPTEIYYAAGLPRVQCGQLVMMPSSCHFIETAVPVDKVEDVY